MKRTEVTLDNYRGVAAEVLLLYGSDTDSVFKVTAEALQSVLPHSICMNSQIWTIGRSRITANLNESDRARDGPQPSRCRMKNRTVVQFGSMR